MAKPVRLMLSGWPPNVEVGSYTVDGFQTVQREIDALRKLDLTAHQFQTAARAIMERQKAHDKPLIEAYIREHGIPDLGVPMPGEEPPPTKPPLHN